MKRVSDVYDVGGSFVDEFFQGVRSSRTRLRYRDLANAASFRCPVSNNPG